MTRYRHQLAGGMFMSAEYSDDEIYRYTLGRSWSGNRDQLECESGALWIMLNPSTATHEQDDPTIRRCIDFSKRWGYHGLTIANLWWIRTPSPAKLKQHFNDVPPGRKEIQRADSHLLALAGQAKLVVAAWGNHGNLGDRGAHVRELMFTHQVPMKCLGRTSNGAPVHPLYQPATTDLQEY